MPTDARGDDGAAAPAFALLLAAALLLHVLWWHGPVVRSPWAAVAVAAVWLIARPPSVGRLALLLAAAAGAIVAELPALGSHLLLVLATAVCVLAHLGLGLVRRPPGGGGRGWSPASGDGYGGSRPGRPPGGDGRGGGWPRGDDLWPRLVPLLRAEVVVLYVAAALAKLNDVYLDPATSPAGVLAGKVAWFAPTSFDGDWRATVAVWGSLAVEAALPVLLLVPRTRRVGLVLGLAFHGVLAASGTVPFTALMLALYVGFLPAGAVGWPVVPAIARRGRTRTRRTEGLPLVAGDGSTRAGRPADLPLVAAALVGLWATGALVGLDPGRTDGSVLATLTRLVLLASVLAAIAAVLRRGTAAGASTPSGRPRGVFVAGAAVLVLCAASPYLGWRTGDAFTMYSGLRTSPSGWNHVLLPSAVRLRH